MRNEKWSILWTESEVSERSSSKNERIGFRLARAIRLAADMDVHARRTANMCKDCYYQGPHVAGAAMTTWYCRACNKEGLHGNTAYPFFCKECAKDYDLCVGCGADIELRVKRRKKLPDPKVEK